MRFTVIMPSYLGDYPGAASDREQKIVRAINSVIGQSYKDWELIIVADGCDRTMQIASQFVESNIMPVKIDKAETWSGVPRNTGIEMASGDYIVYLDNDDYYGPDHLKIIADNIGDYDWVWYNDYIFDTKGWQWIERACNIKKRGANGTSNVCHKKLDVTWDHTGYAHDHHFNSQLLRHRNHTKIETPEYLVCHIPGSYDV